ncbi:MAG: alpha/beta fold hydrolase [Acidimicrobiales bacterium]|nr:alpha/beta fold hydrolase [Acidimicrobiales bacterium]MCB9373926.1 alpha/beta fold hydrolase [Microthrixaceae bacterium]
MTDDAGVLATLQVTTDLVPSPVEVRTLTPRGLGADAPLLLLLHGGGDSASFLDGLAPLFDRLWGSGELPGLVVATPSAGRSFYLDRADGSQRWETFLFDELLPQLVATTGAGRGGDAVAVCGVSMGGLGALRLAFARPDRFVAVAALEPAIEEATRWPEVARRDVVYRDAELLASLYGDPIDEEHFHANHPRALAERHGPLIAAAGLDVYLEVGDEDLLHLQYGTEALHRQLVDHGIDHEYRLVRRGNHVGPSLGPRFADALGFVGRSLARRAGAVEPSVPDWFAAFVHDQEAVRGYRRRTVLDGPAGPIEVRLQGEGPVVVLVPSLGRGAADFGPLSARLARAGYLVAAPEPRGLGASAGPLDGLRLGDLADDVAAVVAGLDAGAATVVGHAFGNRVARMVATRRPDLVESVVLLACGGRVPPEPDAGEALFRVFDGSLPPDEHLEAVRTAFFAPGNDAAVWADGWHADVAAAQSAATGSTPVDEWWAAGGADVLVVQPAEDRIAVAANADQLVEALGDRATRVTIPRAGHALLPEQPAAVAVALLTWLDRRRRR